MCKPSRPSQEFVGKARNLPRKKAAPERGSIKVGFGFTSNYYYARLERLPDANVPVYLPFRHWWKKKVLQLCFVCHWFWQNKLLLCLAKYDFPAQDWNLPRVAPMRCCTLVSHPPCSQILLGCNCLAGTNAVTYQVSKREYLSLARNYTQV